MSEAKLQGKVIGCLQDGFVTIIIGYGAGMMDGGYPEPIPVELVPPALRLPNTVLDVIAAKAATHP
jgi:hypothetical protein